MYTTTPLVDGQFTGYIIAFCLTFFVWAVFTALHWVMEGELVFKSRWNLFYWGLIVIISGIVYAMSPPYVPPKNEKVHVVQVGYGGQIESTGGKHSRNYYQMYAFYQTPHDGVIALRRAEGKVYPQNAILYKN